MKFDPKFMDLDASISVFGERYDIMGNEGGFVIDKSPGQDYEFDFDSSKPVPFVGADGGYYDLMPDGTVVPKG